MHRVYLTFEGGAFEMQEATTTALLPGNIVETKG